MNGRAGVCLSFKEARNLAQQHGLARARRPRKQDVAAVLKQVQNVVGVSHVGIALLLPSLERLTCTRRRTNPAQTS